MPINVTWFNSSKTIIHWQLEGVWTIEEYIGAAKQTALLGRESPHYNIIAEGIDKAPAFLMRTAIDLHRGVSERYGFTVIVAPTFYIQTLGKLLETQAVTTGRLHFTESLTQAIAICEKANPPSPEQV
jgi:hypothetical protein